MLILYDPACHMCVSLAQFLKRKSHDQVQIAPSDGIELGARLEEGGPTLWGVEAWTAILEHYPGSQDLRWLATKLGLVSPLAQSLHRAGKLYRKFCKNC